MRDVKFRGYQQALGYFVEGSYLYTPQETNDDGIAHWIVREDGFKYAIMNPETIGRYTGLKDKNGVEIFDGDVIPSNYTTFSKGELKVQVVRFLDGGFRRLSVHRKWGPYGAYGEAEIADWHDQGCLSKDAAMETEVLGNIYENPELLEEEE